MPHYIALAGTQVSLVVSVVASLGLATYLILIAAFKGFFHRYTILYMYLFAATLCTGMGALSLWAFGIDSDFYAYVFYFSKAPMTLLKFLVVCWLYWSILSSDYPSIRFSFVIVFLVTTAIFLFYFSFAPCMGSCPCGSLTGNMLFHTSYYTERYFTMAQILLLTILGAVLSFGKLRLNQHLKGIAIGLGASFVLTFIYSGLKQISPNPFVRYLYPMPYLTMLAIFCYYLSSEASPTSQLTVSGLKSLDAKVFDVLSRTGLYNRYTDSMFFGFFDRQDAADLDRWKRYRRAMYGS